MNRPEVTYQGILDIQVCVPEDWTDERVLEFAEQENPCGTTAGWGIRKEGSKQLAGAPERNPCEQRENYVHIMLDA